jgi:hypothetical protein
MKSMLKEEINSVEMDDYNSCSYDADVNNLKLDSPVRDYPLENILKGSLSELVKEAWRVNILAKEESEDWYDIKETLLRKIAEKASLYPGLSWGVGYDERIPVLYIDLPGHGQISFHLPFWTDKQLEDLPEYDFGWTGIVNDSFEKNNIDPVIALINRRSALNGNQYGFSRGEIHNQLVIAEINPEWAYREDKFVPRSERDYSIKQEDKTLTYKLGSCFK